MGCCERCWGDAYMRFLSDPTKSQGEHYQALLKERKDNPCSELEQKGARCSKCDSYFNPIELPDGTIICKKCKSKNLLDEE